MRPRTMPQFVRWAIPPYLCDACGHPAAEHLHVQGWPCLACGSCAQFEHGPLHLDDMAAARKRAAIPTAIKQAVLARDGVLCRYCGETTLANPHSKRTAGRKRTFDHLVAVSCGGENTVENLVIACRDCNYAKGARDLLTFLLHRWGESHPLIELANAAR